ncbi:MAG: RIO1 family regulatory kinase/ATPase [Candidatus Thermoplasmatota archaeon]
MRQAWKGGALVPAPAKRVENLLAMRYLGGDDGPAPRLADLQPVDPRAFLDELLAATEALLLAGVVHGDLSAYNVLIHEDRPWFIDFSDGLRVDRLGSAPWMRLQLARETLTRDLEGLRAYFRKFEAGFDVAATAEGWIDRLQEQWELTHGRRRRPTPEGTPGGTPAPP